jgi:hypothetical protein
MIITIRGGFLGTVGTGIWGKVVFLMRDFGEKVIKTRQSQVNSISVRYHRTCFDGSILPIEWFL